MKIFPLPPGEGGPVGLAAGFYIAVKPPEDGGGAVTAPGEDEGREDPASGPAGQATDDLDADGGAVGEETTAPLELEVLESTVGAAVWAA